MLDHSIQVLYLPKARTLDAKRQKLLKNTELQSELRNSDYIRSLKPIGKLFVNSFFVSLGLTGLSFLGVPGVPWHPQILPDQ